MKKREIKRAPRFELTGVMPESVLNACALSGLPLWELESLDAYTVRFSAAAGDRERIEAIANKCMCELRVLSYGEKDRRRAMLRRRRLMAVFLLAVAALLGFSSFFVWDIEIEGEQSLTEGEIKRALEDCGLYEGCWWPAISSDMVRSLMIEKLPDIAWLSVNVSGSRAQVTVMERQKKPEIYAEDEHVNIVAAKTGIIEKMYVFNGERLVSAGQSVLEGDVLVSGSPVSIGGESRSIRARAQVWADTWYELCAVSPDCPEKSYHGPGWARLALKFGKNRINFYISSGKGVDECDKIISEYKIGVKGLFTLPVTVVIERIRPYRLEASAAQSAGDMEARLYAELLSRLSPGEVRQHSFAAGSMDGGTSLTLYAQCFEDIAREEPARS